MRQVVAPLADRFQPELLLVSAGFDAHWRDPLAQMRLANVDFVMITRLLKEIAEDYCDGRLLLVQEGGYDIDALAQSATSCFNVLLGGDEAVDTLGDAPPAEFRWNPDAIVEALRDLHGLVGYRRKPNKPQVRYGWVPPEERDAASEVDASSSEPTSSSPELPEESEDG